MASPPPENDAAPAATRAGVKDQNDFQDNTLDYNDVHVVYALSAMLRHQEAAERAARLGPALVPDGPARAVAALILNGDRRMLDLLDPQERRKADSLGRAVVRCEVPGEDGAWASHLVWRLSEDRVVPLLIQTLRWAQTRAKAGASLPHIRRCLDRALRVALGEDDPTSSGLISDDATEVAA